MCLGGPRHECAAAAAARIIRATDFDANVHPTRPPYRPRRTRAPDQLFAVYSVTRRRLST